MSVSEEAAIEVKKVLQFWWCLVSLGRAVASHLVLLYLMRNFYGEVAVNQQHLDKCSYAGKNKPAWLAQNQSLHGLVNHHTKTESAYGSRSLVKGQMCLYSQLFPQELRVTCGTNCSIVLAQSPSRMQLLPCSVFTYCRNSLVLDFICASDEIFPLSPETQ